MRISVLGGDPCGLYFAYRWKVRHPGDAVTVFEQNAQGATFGFGVVFSDRAMDFIRAGDPETADQITALMETWSNISLIHNGEKTEIDGVGFSAIGRLDLLLLPRERASRVGVELRFDHHINPVADIPPSDVIVAADAPAYWNRSEKTAETMRAGGWNYTGDRMLKDRDGFYKFLGRADELVKVSGQWVYPLEVELCLSDHELVRKCAVLAREMSDRRMMLETYVVCEMHPTASKLLLPN